MFGAHWPELIIFLIAALVIFGPKRLPEIGGAMGKGIREFKKGSTGEADEQTDTKAAPPAQIPTAKVESPAATPVEPEVVHAAAPTQEQEPK